MLLSNTPDAKMCHAFSTTLKKESIQLFKGLLKHSIFYFHQLVDQFLVHFPTCRSHKKISPLLINIKQGKGKPFKNYPAWYNHVALEIKELPLVVVMHSILVELRLYNLSKSLAKRIIETVIELLT